MSKSPILFSSDDEDEGSLLEVEVLRKFQTMLQGVPPPSSVTLSKLSVTDMLNKYKENESSFAGAFTENNCSKKYSIKMNATPLVYYLNSSHVSEEIANLSQKVQSRFIYSETMSSCNVWFDSSIKTNSSKKRSGLRNGFGLSPGSRLSHLARRRQMFSCENLQQLANSERRRHIEIKKQAALKNKSIEKHETLKYEKLNMPKRALFLSPENEEKQKTLSNKSIKRNLFPNFDVSKMSNVKTVASTQLSEQNILGGSSKKRRRTEIKEGNGNWPRRALTFNEEDSDKTQETRNAKVISELQLSLHHKSKLLWAVSVTLKEKNMSSKDPHFKTCASALFMICRKNLGKILNLKIEGGTSEKMLHFAREQIGGIFKKLGIFKEDISDTRNVDVLGIKNDANSIECSEGTKEEPSEKNAVNTNENDKSCRISESPSNSMSRNEKVQTSVNEKENIDV